MRIGKRFVPALIGTTSLVCSLAVMAALILLRKPPAAASEGRNERAIPVEAIAATPTDVPVTIKGFGQVESLTVVRVSPEVSGRVVEIHPQLLVGGIVRKGETLFALDPEMYEARIREADSQVSQLESTIQRLRLERDNEQGRMDALARSRDLAQAQYERLAQLFRDDEVGTQTGVDEAERAYVAAKDQADQLAHEIGVYPVRIAEADDALATARAQSELARMNLERTRVAAPFDARVKWVQLKKDQVIGPGEEVVQLADDSVLEISVPLDSRDARHWLQFEGEPTVQDASWFSSVQPVECSIRWTEETDGHLWTGTLDRIEAFDQASRTVTVAVRVSGGEAFSQDDERLPLVDGMFCEVEIPGKAMHDVFCLPQSTISLENTVFVAENSRLKTVPVRVERQQNNDAYVTEGLNPGDLVIATRLVNPLEGSLLDVTTSGDTESE